MGIPLNIAPEDQLPLNVDRQGLRQAADYEIENSSQFNRGWNAAGIGEDANALMSKSLSARRNGDEQGGAIYEQQARDLMAQAQQWAPTVQNITDVTGLRSGLDWAGGALGNVRSSLMPAVGSTLGTLGGGALGYMVGGAPGTARGAKYGAGVGAGLFGGKAEYDEAVANAMTDDAIRGTRSYDDIHNAALTKGAINAGLESLVPMSVTNALLGNGAKAVGKSALKTVGKEVAKGMAEEGLTEGTQSLVGQGAQNYLKGNDLTDFDYTQAANEAAAGAIGGGGMGVLGGAGHLAHSGAGKAADKAAEVTSDPLGTVLDAGTALARKAGQLTARAENYFDTKDKLAEGKTQDEIDRELLNEMMGERMRSAADPVGADEAHLSDSELVAKRREQAAADGWDGNGDWLEHSRKVKAEREAKAESDSTDEFLRTIDGEAHGDAENGAAFKIGDDVVRKSPVTGRAMDAGRIIGDVEPGDLYKHGQWLVKTPEGRTVRMAKKDASGKQALHQLTDADLDHLGMGRSMYSTLMGTKKSRMRPTLTDDFGEQEGRDMSKDMVTDDFGTAKRSDTWDSNLNGPESYARRSTLAEMNKVPAELTKMNSARTNQIAKVLVNQGYSEKTIRAVDSADALDQDVRKVTGILNWGAEYWFHKNDAARQDKVVNEMVKQFGKSAPELFRQSYEAGVREGLFPRDDATADSIEQKLTDTHKSNKVLGDVLVASLRPTARAELESRGKPGSAAYKKALANMVAEVRRVVNKGSKGNDIRQAGNVKSRSTGIRNINDDHVMNLLFGRDEKIISELVDAFYSPKEAGNAYGARPEAIEATGSGIVGEDDLNTEDMVPERQTFEEALGESGNEARVVEKREYHGDFHNTNKAEGLAALEAVESELKGKHDKLHRVGMRTALLDQYATKHDTTAEDLSPQERVKALEGAVLKQWPELASSKPGGIQPTANDATKRDYAERTAKWQKTVEARAKLLERNMQTVMTSTEDQTDSMPNEFDLTAVKALRLDRDMDHPRNSPEEGTLVFKLKTGGDFITSAPLLMRKMHRVRGLLGDDGSYHKELKGGRVQNASRILLEAVASMVTSQPDYFTGKFGYVKGGKFIEVGSDKASAKTFPANFRVTGSTENGNLVTWGDSTAADKDARADLKSKDIDREDFATGQVKRDPTTFDKTEALKAAEKAGTVDTSYREKLGDFLKAFNSAKFAKLNQTDFGKALIAEKTSARAASKSAQVTHKLNAEIAKLKTMSVWDYQREQAQAAKKAAEPRIKPKVLSEIVGAQQTKYEAVLDQWVDRVFPNGITVSEQIPGEAERGTAVDGLAAYDAATDIVRDERGSVMSSNTEMVAQTHVGTSRVGTKPVAVREKGERLKADERIGESTYEEQGDVPTAPVDRIAEPTTTEQKNALVRLEEMRDNVVSLIRNTTGTLLGAIETMSAEEINDLDHAVFGDSVKTQRQMFKTVDHAKKLTEYAGETTDVRDFAGLINLSAKKLGDLYFDGEAGAGRATLGRLTGAAERIKNAISKRKTELKNGIKRGTGSDAQESSAVAGSDSGEIGKTDGRARGGRGEGEGVGAKQSSQKSAGEVASEADRKAAVDHITKTLGDSVSGSFTEAFADGSSGSWTQGDVKNAIRLALNGNILQTSFHESFHEFMDILRKHGGAKVEAQIMRAASSPMMKAKLDRLLNGHPEAQAQLSDPEEAAAYMYQFWMAGKLNLGPETKSAFQRIVDWFKSVTGMLADEVKRMEMDELQTEKLMRAFSAGAMADTSSRQAVVEAMNHSVEVNEAAQVKVGKAMQALNDTAGKLLFSAEAMVEATGNKYMGDGAALFHQKAGTAMRTQTFMDATRQKTSLYMNKLENTLMGFDKADLELAREGMSTEKRPTSKAAGQAYDAMKAYFKEMADYLEEKEVKRLDFINGKPTWVKIDFRKHYWPQVWDMDVMEKNLDGFRSDLMEHHADILAKIAKEANEEVKRRKGAGEGTASSDQIASGEGKEITPAMIADAIVVRMQYTNGQVDIDESLDELGITPMAAAVNRRKLDWLDPEVFDKYKSKDIAKIMTTYTVNMVKRAEYQQRFGPGGEVLRDLSDKAILLEVGGDKLVSYAEGNLDDAVEEWNKAAAAWGKNNPTEKYDAPYPTLRTVGLQHHAVEVGKEKAAAASKSALKKLEQGFKAFQAMEGTLGRDISPNFRTFSSWMVTYQNFTKLSTMLFTSFQDVMGIVANGGEMNDAWNAFVSGIKEIKNSWTDKKDGSRMMNRAELWGAVDAGSFADAIGQAYGSSFMTGHARRMSDKFFKWTGAEGWNRGVRAVAAQVAERTILEWKQDGVDLSDPAAKARIERLYGKGATADSIRLDADGQLDISSPANQAAVTRWVLDAVPTTSAAHRPIWGSDPHYQMFIQFKNYTYSFHRILLKGAVEQAKLGNYRPALVLAVGYMPIAIAGGAIKEMLIPGEEPPWMQGGLDDYLSYGFTKAGVLGVPQMYAQNLYDLDPAATFGPSIDQLQNVMSIPMFENRTLLGEGLGALPGGNLLRRAAN